MNNVLVISNSSKEYKFGLFDNRHDTILATIPPLLFGLGSAFAIWSDQLFGSIAAWVCIALVISAGGAITLIKGMPAWGDTWLGTFLIFIALFLRLLMEEGKGVGLPISSPLISGVVTVLISIALIALIITVALKGWRRVGLVSIGLSTALEIGIWDTFARPPFNRGDLSLLVAPIGIITAVCIYLYVRKSDTVRFFSFMIIWILCLLTVWISSHVYKEWFNAHDRAFPSISMMAVLSILLWSGPLMAWTISFGQKIAKRLLIKHRLAQHKAQKRWPEVLSSASSLSTSALYHILSEDY